MKPIHKYSDEQVKELARSLSDALDEMATDALVGGANLFDFNESLERLRAALNEDLEVVPSSIASLSAHNIKELIEARRKHG